MSGKKKENKKDEDDGAFACCDTCAMTLNGYIEKAFCAVGFYVGQWPYLILALVLIFLAICCIGLAFVVVETNIYNLWTPTDSPVFQEEEFINFYWSDNDYGLLLITGVSKEGEHTNILSEEYMEQWYELHLDLFNNLPHKNYTYTPSDGGAQKIIDFAYLPENYFEPDSLTVLSQKAALGLGPSDYASEVVPLCRHLSQSPAEAQFEMPCYMLSVLDCFSEGGYFFPWENYLQNTLLSSIVPANPFTYRDSFAGKTSIELGESLGPSCQTWSGTTAPSNYIYGGETRLNSSDASSTIIELKSYQTVAYIDSAVSFARKVKIATGQCLYTSTYAISCPDVTDEEVEAAEEFMSEWLADYIDFMKAYAEDLANDDSKLFKLVFWTPRTSSDLLREASSADLALLAAAYIIMIIFASLTAINVNNWFLSRSEASFAGVVLVLLAVVATIGLGSFLAVPLSPNVVQVLPFIALGFGVDDMFILLFSFKYREKLKIEEMIAETTRIAGSSVALTSLANFFGFLIGTTMVLPDVARFATYGAIVVLLNFVAIIFGFTAVLALVARRMRNRYNDWSFFCFFAGFTKATVLSSEKPSAQAPSVFDPLFDWLTKTYTRVVMMIAFVALIIVGGYGCTLISPGLPLADIVPYNHYASDFLRIRELFYFSYIVSLYTDAQEAEWKPIDWENKFETWVDRTEDIYSISDIVYTDPSVHDFWAWQLRDYLAEKYTESLTMQYALGTPFDIAAALADDPVYQAYQCMPDIQLYCSTLPRDFAYGSDLYNCLLVNYQLGTLTSDDCVGWVYQVLLENIDIGAVARQIEVISYEDSTPNDADVNGLYVRPSSNDIKVYAKYPNNDGFIYQEDCGLDMCQWFLLDGNYNVIYQADATSVEDSEAPAQGGWRDTDGNVVKVTHLYYDFYVSYLSVGRDLSVFFQSDVTASTSFAFTQQYGSSYDSTTSCKQWEVMRLLMQDSQGFTRIAMNNVFDNNNTAFPGQYDTVCNAILESTEMCAGIRDQSDLGPVRCGGKEAQTLHTLWYIGTANDDEYQIASSPYQGEEEGLFISDDTFDSCADPTQFKNYTNFTYNFLKPCGDASNFGGFGLNAEDNSTWDLCNSEEQEISLQCDEFTDCTDLRVCYADYERLFASIGVADCNSQKITQFDYKWHQGLSDFVLSLELDECLFRHYNKLTSCCQTAVNEFMLTNPQYTCKALDNLFTTGGTKDADQADDLRAVCTAKDKCVYDDDANECTEYVTSSAFDDCALLVTDYEPCIAAVANMTDTMIRQGEQQAFVACLTTGVNAKAPDTFNRVPLSGSIQCKSTFNTERTTYENCMYPVKSFWDFDAQKYDYTMCSDAEIASIANQTCGVNNTADDTQFECLQTNSAALPAGCCKRAMEQIQSSTYSFTNECEADVDFYCSFLNAFGIDPSPGSILLAYSQSISLGTQCINALLLAYNDQSLSPKCADSLIYCEPVGDWPGTMMGATAELPCAEGYAGMQTRTCQLATSTADFPVTWADVDTSQCVQLSCPEILADDDSDNVTVTYNQYWPEMPVGSVYTIQGGAINKVFKPFGYPDILTETQISTELMELAGQNCSYDAEEFAQKSIYYARRKCQLDPYNTSRAVWADPIVECRPFSGVWNNVQSQTVCDFVTEQVVAGVSATISPYGSSLPVAAKANLIDAIVWSIYDETVNDNVSTSQVEQIALSQAYCSSILTKCAAFTYDDVFKITYFFDYCPTLTAADFQGIVPEIVNAPADVQGILTAIGFGAYGLDATVFYPWSTYPDPIAAEFAPSYGLTMATFADRHTTYIAPMSSAESIASYCSLKSLGGITNLEEDVPTFIAPQNAWNAQGIPMPQCFNNTLWLFFIDPTGGVLYRDKIVFRDPTQVSNILGFDDVQIVTTYNSISVNNIDDDEVAVNLIIDLRARLDSWANDDELYVVPGGLVINLFSQYIGVQESMILNLVYVSIAIVLCGVIFLLNPIAIIVALLCNTAMIVEVYGFADWLGLRVNGVLVLNMVIAVALTMEFTAHVGRAFILTTVTEKDRVSSLALPFSDDGQIRMKKTLREMFTPVSLGALTTIIGVTPIAFAQFPYFRQYYFTLYIMIVLFGWLNGVIFQPIILSFIPPKPFVVASKYGYEHRGSSYGGGYGGYGGDKGYESQNDYGNSPKAAVALQQHHELQIENTGKTQTEGYGGTANSYGDAVEEEAVASYGDTKTGYMEIEDESKKQELIQRKHTRGDEDAP